MNTDRWLRIKEIFRGALEHGPRERGAFLDEACRGDPDLRREVEGLLSSHDGSDAFLEPPSGAGLLDDDWEEELSSTRIGQYLIQEAISSGGMGTVYKALQENPKRTVAIKVMREGIASRSALKRFEYESQILARLTHPNIAQVIEAGTHWEKGRDKTDGLPYFVMEYIPDARSVTDYALEKKLALSRRLKLFLQVCDAVHHGHQKGIIHRDLKPSNVLVNASGQVKIIDFGVARATDSDLTLTTAQTDVGKLIGTVQYMSPEQCTADPNDIDTRSDVYALGVVLYELLCETLPYDVRNAAVFEATRVIRERDPRKPSTIKRTLRGDMETIVLKALEKERGQRYQTVAAFATDIRRFLDGEVILARPAGPMTRTLKQIRRNPILSTAVAVAVAAIVIFAGYVLFVSNPQLRRERDVAEEKTKRAFDAERTAVDALKEAESQRTAARAAQLAAERKANINMALYQYLSDMLSSPMPVRDGREVRVLDIIKGAEKELDTAFIDQPEIEEYLRSIIGKTYKSLGRFEEAARQFRLGMELSRRTHGEEYRNTLLHMVDLGHTLTSLGEHREAESILREAIELESRSSGEEHENTLHAKSLLAAALKAQGKNAVAESILREVIELQCRTLGDDHPKTLFSLKLLADIHFLLGRYAEAESLYRKVMEDRRRVSGEEHPATIFAMKGLADTLRNLDKEVEAESMTREVLEIFRRVYGDEDMDTLEAMSCLALLLRNRNAFIEAESLLREVVEISCRVKGDEHQKTLAYMNNLATVLCVQDKRTEAKSLFQKVLEIRRRVSGKEDSNTLGAMTNLAIIYHNEGNDIEAERLHREVLETRRRISGEDHPFTLQAKLGLVQSLLGTKKYHEAERICGELLEIYRERLGPHHRLTLDTTRFLAKALRKMGEFDEAEALYLEGLEIVRKKQPPNDYDIASFYSDYGKGLFYEERYEESEKHLREAYRIFLDILGERHKDTLNVVRFFIMLYDAREDEEEADKWRAKLASAVPKSGDL